MAEDHEQIESLLSDYVDDSLDANSSRVVDAHLVANPATRAIIEKMRLDRAQLRGLPRLTVPADLSEDLRGRLERDQLLNDEPTGNSTGRRMSPPFAAVAAILLVGVGLASVAYMLLANRPKPYAEIALRDQTDAVKDSSPMASEAEVAERMVATQSQSLPPEPKQVDAKSNNASDAAAMPKIASGTTPDVNAAKREDASAASPALSAAKAAAEVRAAAPVAGANGMNVENVTFSYAIEVSAGPPPADVSLALAGQQLNRSRRSVAIVVDQRDALDALASTNRAARVAGGDVEVAANAATIALEKAGAMAPGASAEFAAVARGLAPSVARDVQQELTRLHPNDAPAFAFDLPAPIVTATTAPAGVENSVAAKDESRDFENARNYFDPQQVGTRSRQSSQVATSLVRDAAAGRADDLQNTSTTRPIASGMIEKGERLRITLIDPDAFDLRTQHEVLVDPQGNIALPSLDAVVAVGESADALRASIVDAYQRAKLMRRPIVRVESLDHPPVEQNQPVESEQIDLYLVIRRPSTMPSTAPSSMPSTNPTTQPG